MDTADQNYKNYAYPSSKLAEVEVELEECRFICAGGYAEPVTVAVLTATLVPFVQAIATHAGQDVYAAIRRLLPLDKQRNVDESSPLEFKMVERLTHTTIITPTYLPESAARQLAAMRLSDPAIRGAKLLWSPRDNCWLAFPGGRVQKEPLVWDGHGWVKHQK